MNKWLFLVPILLLTVASCGDKKEPNKSGISIDSAAFAKGGYFEDVNAFANGLLSAPKTMTPNERLIADMKPIWDKRISFTTFKGKAKMHYEGGGQKQDFTANFRVLHDSVIWIHITAGMGIVNVARILITQDSLQMINYLQKEVTQMPITAAQKLIPVAADYSTIENLIMGDVLNRSGSITSAHISPELYSLNVTDDEMRQQIKYNKQDSTLQSLQMLSVVGKSGVAGMIQYKDYETISFKKFSNDRVIHINNNKELHYLTMNFNNAAFDEQLNFPFNVPSSYHKVEP